MKRQRCKECGGKLGKWLIEITTNGGALISAIVGSNKESCVCTRCGKKYVRPVETESEPKEENVVELDRMIDAKQFMEAIIKAKHHFVKSTLKVPETLLLTKEEIKLLDVKKGQQFYGMRIVETDVIIYRFTEAVGVINEIKNHREDAEKVEEMIHKLIGKIVEDIEKEPKKKGKPKKPAKSKKTPLQGAKPAKK